ncbi:MAG TPA: alpha/beta hydrolase [Chloroflexota bacterium]|nr:alpha/beta hydrolase [Chloroflexota bacterium]
MHMSTDVYKTVDGHAISADVYRSADDVVRPTLVYIHGGALIMGSRSGLDETVTNRYVAAGFGVVAIDYRLAPETKLPAIADDLADAFRWVRTVAADHYHLDPGRVAVVGHSAGGYLALLSGVRVRPRPTAIVSYYGYGDIVGPWYSQPDPFYCQQPRVPEAEARAAVGNRPVSDARGPEHAQRGRFYLYSRQHGRWPREVAGVDPGADPDFFTPYCPERNVTGDYPPTLLLHGDQDTDVPYEQSVLMARRLREAGVEHELLTIAGGGHGFDRAVERPDVARALDRALAFLVEQSGL